MTTLVQYQHQVDELKLENIPLAGVNPDQARQSLEKPGLKYCRTAKNPGG